MGNNSDENAARSCRGFTFDGLKIGVANFAGKCDALMNARALSDHVLRRNNLR